MKILILGANGQVGWELQRTLIPLGEIKACTRKEADLEQLEALKNLIQTYKPQIIVNAAAYSAVDQAETQQEKVQRINTEAVELIAKETKQLKGLLIHYSTDYIFDGRKTTPYKEQDQPNPQSVYGKSKYQGEQKIAESGCNHLIFRTSWVYATRGNNFLNTIIKLAQERDELHIVNDQVGSPTSATLIADITALALYKLIQQPKNTDKLTGTYHLTPTGETSWYFFAKQILKQVEQQGIKLKTTAEKINSIRTEDYPLPAKRPKNSSLNTIKLQQTFNIHLPTWQQQLKRILLEMFP